MKPNALNSDFLKDNPTIYVARDKERAMGLALPTGGYFVLSSEGSERPDTHELLALPETKQFIDSIIEKNSHASVLVFKNTALIQDICRANKWRLLNPSALLSQKVEEKISQVAWLGPLEKYLPPHEIVTCKDLSFSDSAGDKPYIIQFNHAHSGEGTLFIEKESNLAELKEKFPNRFVRKTAFIEGPIFTSNNVVTKDGVLVGNISLQITGLAPFTDGRFTTIGNDWALPRTLLTEAQRKQYAEMVTAIGDRLRVSGWKGLFGVDIVLSSTTERLHLIEINARQPASATFESELQRKIAQEKNISGETVFSAHLKALLDLPTESDLIEITDGAQIVQRVTKNITFDVKKTPAALEEKGFHVVLYENKDLNSDLLRIQSTTSLMKNPTTLNDRGQKIADLLTPLSS